ncbi:MAG TPA: hypothetical protein VG097_08585, partial [Gemmata sp.]|nr:hypothetical protein [Gemmata sp.]
MGHWLLKFVRKFLFIQRLRRPLRWHVRAKVYLRVELLEDRSVPSVLSDEVSSVVYASLSASVTMDPSGATVTLLDGSVSTTGLRGPGLDGLIVALRKLAPSSFELLNSFSVKLLSPSVVTPTVDVDPGSPPSTVEGGSAHGSTTTAGGSGNVGAPVSPTPILAGTPQGVSGGVGALVTTASASLDPAVPQLPLATTPGLAPSGPVALDSRAPPEATGAAFPIAPGGSSPASPQAPSLPGANAATNPLVPGTDVGVFPQELPDATGAGPTGGGSPGPRTP